MTAVGDTRGRMARAEALLPAMIAHRRHLHAHPEVGLDLPLTHDYVAATLRSLGYQPETHAGGGVTALVEGAGRSGPVRVLRADMDALPLQENTGLAFSSAQPGAMHACGHDLHTAMLLGAAELFRASPPQHDVVLAFQPGEEFDRGALRLLGHETLQLPPWTVAFAIHVNAVLPAGTVTSRAGIFMAHGDWFEVSFTGSGGHASAPELSANPIEGAADWVLRLRGLSRQADGGERRVATATEVVSGNSVNVIPVEGRLRGTIRTLSERSRDDLHAALRRITDETAQRFGLRGDCRIVAGYPALENDERFLRSLETAMRAELGLPLTPMPEPSMVIEDFAYFLQRWPGAMVYLGARVAGRHSFNHSEDVVFDESVMTTGLALHSLVADLPQPPTPA